MLSSITLMVLLKAPKRGKFKRGEENAILSAPSAARLLLKMERWDYGVGAPNPAACSELKGKHCPVHELSFAHQKMYLCICIAQIYIFYQRACYGYHRNNMQQSSLVHPRPENCLNFLKGW